MFFLLSSTGPAVRPLILAHYMPWYESKPISGHWGWHWTMNHYNPDDRTLEGRQPLASRFRPLIGLYDSSDPDTLECQTLQMKIAGIDGVSIDWYGTKDLNDYSILNRNTGKMIGACSRAGLKFSIVIEDQVVPQLVKAGKSTSQQFAQSALSWMKNNWFSKSGYVRWHGQPVLLIFGPQYYKEPEFSALFGGSSALFTLLNKNGAAVGAFGWPEPQVGDEESWSQLANFYDRAKTWSAAVAVAYPRFKDIYKDAGVGRGYGEIEDRAGSTFRRTLDMAFESGQPFVQLATWNDWGEGTQIEPSKEFGYRDLEVVQRHRRATDPGFAYREADLRLPEQLYRLRKEGRGAALLDRVAHEILVGHCARAAEILKSFAP
jgi:hypothetical protein